MTIRPFKLPNDLDLMNSLIMDGFQYPENPAWSVQEDEKAGMIDRIRGIKRIWPLMRLMQILSPSLRNIMNGYIFEQDGNPVGLVNYMSPPGRQGEWMIANVTVLPAYRRQRIARKLVDATLSTLRERKAKLSLLEVIEENLPAFNLYKELGFIPYASEIQYDAPDMKIALPSLPDGWSATPLSDSNWRVRYELAIRTTPEKVKQFEPISERKFKTPVFLRIFSKLFEITGGTRNSRMLLGTPDGKAAGVAFHSVRIRPGGVNYAGFVLDPAYSGMAAKFMQFVLASIQQASPGRRIEMSLNDWQLALIEAAGELGCIKRLSAYRMGLVFPEK
ncbi:MAG: GNAT family N-acetyltransferase [Chloroflexi bacterium]|nr:GNAT family N-acetyltransferase [Chloroflexota bacterium]